MAKAKNWYSRIASLGPCGDEREWAESKQNAKEAWESCDRGDWMLWLVEKISDQQGIPSHRKLVLTACECARLSLKYVTKGDERPRIAIETAERWARRCCDVTIEDVREAAYAAYAAAYAANAAAGAAQRKRILKKCANIVRKRYSLRQILSAARKAGI